MVCDKYLEYLSAYEDLLSEVPYVERGSLIKHEYQNLMVDLTKSAYWFLKCFSDDVPEIASRLKDLESCFLSTRYASAHDPISPADVNPTIRFLKIVDEIFSELASRDMRLFIDYFMYSFYVAFISEVRTGDIVTSQSFNYIFASFLMLDVLFNDLIFLIAAKPFRTEQGDERRSGVAPGNQLHVVKCNKNYLVYLNPAYGSSGIIKIHSYPVAGLAQSPSYGVYESALDLFSEISPMYIFHRYETDLSRVKASSTLYSLLSTVSLDGKDNVYVACAEAELVKLDRDFREVYSYAANPPNSAYPALAPCVDEKGYVSFCDGNANLVMIDPAGNVVFTVPYTSDFGSGVSMSDDIIVVSNPYGGILVIGRDGTPLWFHILGGDPVQYASIDSRNRVYVADDAGNVYIFSEDGSVIASAATNYLFQTPGCTPEEGVYALAPFDSYIFVFDERGNLSTKYLGEFGPPASLIYDVRGFYVVVSTGGEFATVSYDLSEMQVSVPFLPVGDAVEIRIWTPIANVNVRPKDAIDELASSVYEWACYKGSFARTGYHGRIDFFVVQDAYTRLYLVESGYYDVTRIYPDELPPAQVRTNPISVLYVPLRNYGYGILIAYVYGKGITAYAPDRGETKISDESETGNVVLALSRDNKVCVTRYPQRTRIVDYYANEYVVDYSSYGELGYPASDFLFRYLVPYGQDSVYVFSDDGEILFKIADSDVFVTVDSEMRIIVITGCTIPVYELRVYDRDGSHVFSVAYPPLLPTSVLTFLDTNGNYCMFTLVTDEYSTSILERRSANGNLIWERYLDPVRSYPIDNSPSRAAGDYVAVASWYSGKLIVYDLDGNLWKEYVLPAGIGSPVRSPTSGVTSDLVGKTAVFGSSFELVIVVYKKGELEDLIYEIVLDDGSVDHGSSKNWSDVAVIPYPIVAPR